MKSHHNHNVHCFAKHNCTLSPSSRVEFFFSFISFEHSLTHPLLTLRRTQQLKNFSNLILAQSFINLDEQISKFKPLDNCTQFHIHTRFQFQFQFRFRFTFELEMKIFPKYLGVCVRCLCIHMKIQSHSMTQKLYFTLYLINVKFKFNELFACDQFADFDDLIRVSVIFVIEKKTHIFSAFLSILDYSMLRSLEINQIVCVNASVS